jgi:hypothetical protein
MKLGVIYTVFGTELLEESINNIYDEVDDIVIVWQSTSNRGNVDGQVYQRISEHQLLSKVVLLEFTPDLKLDTKTNELNKFNLGLEHLKSIECTHFLLMATDHLYDMEKFKKAKEKSKKYDLTLSAMYTYYKYPTWQITPIEDYLMPFICRLYPETKYVKGRWPLAYHVDPSVRINTYENHYLFKQEEIMLHHYSMVRQDIVAKFENAAASSRWGPLAKVYLDEYNNCTLYSKLKYFGGRGLKIVDDFFNLGS